MINLSITDIIALGLFMLGLTSTIGLMMARRTFYTVFWLAGIAVVTAGFMALLGFTYLAVFHFVVYVGTTVSFIAFTMLTIGEIKERERRVDTRILLASLLIAIVLWYPLWIRIRGVKPLTVEISWEKVAYIYSTNFWLASLMVLITLAATLIEVITLARRG